MTTPTPDNAARATPVAWAMTDYQADGANTQYTRDSHAAEYWGSQGIQIDPLFDAATVAALEAEVEAWRSQCDGLNESRKEEASRADAAERRVAELERLRDSLDALIQAASPMVTSDVQHERVVDKGSRGHTSISIDPFPLMKFRHEDMRDLKSELERARQILTGARAK